MKGRPSRRRPPVAAAACLTLLACASGPAARPDRLLADNAASTRPPPDPAAIRDALADLDEEERYISARSLSHYLAGLLARESGDDARALAELRLAALYDAQSAWPRYALARELARQGDAARAEATARDALSVEPDHAPTLVLLARLESARRRTGRALTLLRRAAAAAPADPEPWAEMARLRAQRGEWSAAVAAAERLDALLVSGDELPARAAARAGDAFATIARGMEQAGLDTGAEELLRRAAARDPGEPRRWIALTAFFETRERYGEAAEALARTLAPARAEPGLVASVLRLHLRDGRAEPARALLAQLLAAEDRDRRLQAALSLAARALLEAGLLAEAETTAGAALALDGDDPPTRAVLAAVLEGRSRWAEAREAWRQAQADPGLAERARARVAWCDWRLDGGEAALAALRGQAAVSPEGALALAAALEETGRAEDARSLLRDALARAPVPALALALARLAQDAGRADEALAVLEAAAERDPDESAAVLAFADACERAADPRRAVPALQRLAVLRPHHARVPARLARLLAAGPDSDLPAAEAYARQALALRPSDARALETLGAVLLRRGKPAEAVQVLRRAAAAEGADARVHSRLAQAQAAAGRIAEARATYARAASLARASGDEELADRLRQAAEELPAR